MQQEIVQLKAYIEKLAGGPAFPCTRLGPDNEPPCPMPGGAAVVGSGIASIKALSRSTSRAANAPRAA
jgi:hypothetical protein